MSGRGPNGTAPPPPGWLATRRLPIHTVRAGAVLFRIHRSHLGALFFGPGTGKPPTHRFDPLSGRFGVLYAGAALDVAVVETLCRNPARRMIAENEISDRSFSELRSVRDLRFAALYGPGLQKVGTDNAISTGPYEPCGMWADALWDHPDRPDGIAFQSRHDPSGICLAVFERPDIGLSAGAAVKLERLPNIGAILAKYDKSVSPAIS